MTRDMARRAALAAERTPELAAVFDDPSDQAIYGDAKARFEAELAQLKLSEARCAREVCPSAAHHFGMGAGEVGDGRGVYTPREGA